MRSCALAVNRGNFAPDNKFAIKEVIKTVLPDRANPVTPNRIGAPNTVSDICVPNASTPSIMRYPMSVIANIQVPFVYVSHGETACAIQQVGQGENLRYLGNYEPIRIKS